MSREAIESRRARRLDRLHTSAALVTLIGFGLIGGLVLARVFGGI